MTRQFDRLCENYLNKREHIKLPRTDWSALNGLEGFTVILTMLRTKHKYTAKMHGDGRILLISRVRAGANTELTPYDDGLDDIIKKEDTVRLKPRSLENSFQEMEVEVTDVRTNEDGSVLLSFKEPKPIDDTETDEDSDKSGTLSSLAKPRLDSDRV